MKKYIKPQSRVVCIRPTVLILASLVTSKSLGTKFMDSREDRFDEPAEDNEDPYPAIRWDI